MHVCICVCIFLLRNWAIKIFCWTEYLKQIINNNIYSEHYSWRIFLNMYGLNLKKFQRMRGREERERERDVPPTDLLSRWPQWPGLSQAEGRGQAIHIGSQVNGGGSSMCAIFHYFSKAISRDQTRSRETNILRGTHLGCWCHRRWLYQLHPKVIPLVMMFI